MRLLFPATTRSWQEQPRFTNHYTTLKTIMNTRTFTHTTPLVDLLNWVPTTLEANLAQHLLADAWASLITQYGTGLHEHRHSTDIHVGATQLKVSITFDEPVLQSAPFHTKTHIQA